jgi:TetR/AcrR family tetracycline transcriptional repressor
MRLKRSDVLDRALALLEEVGLEALTMRRLAASLGVQPGAIYWHFVSKQALKDAMAEVMVTGLTEPALEGSWDEQLAELSRRMVTAMARYRDGARVMVDALAPGPNALALSEQMLRVLSDGGMSERGGLWAASVLGNYLIGYGMDMQALRDVHAHGMVSVMHALKKVVDPKAHPHVAAAVTDEMMGDLLSPRDIKARFEFGLKLIIDGLKASVPSGHGRKRTAPAKKPRRKPRAK